MLPENHHYDIHIACVDCEPSCCEPFALAGIRFPLGGTAHGVESKAMNEERDRVYAMEKSHFKDLMLLLETLFDGKQSVNTNFAFANYMRMNAVLRIGYAEKGDIKMLKLSFDGPEVQNSEALSIEALRLARLALAGQSK
jgi:hypothetical protein